MQLVMLFVKASIIQCHVRGEVCRQCAKNIRMWRVSVRFGALEARAARGVKRTRALKTQCFQGSSFGGDSGTRTRDLLIANQPLSQLSYIPFNFKQNISPRERNVKFCLILAGGGMSHGVSATR